MTLENAKAQPAFDAAGRTPDPPMEKRNSTMVEKDHPHPAPRPSPDYAMGADREAFTAAWAQETREAADHNRAARLQEFKTMREQESILTRDFQRPTDR